MTAPAKAAPMRDDVTQADREAAGDLCDLKKGYAVSGAIRRGENDEGPTVQAFARHRLTHTARPDAGDEVVERDETCPACEGKVMGPGEFCIAGCRDGKVRWTTANVLRNVLPWLKSAERELDEARAALAAMREGVDRGMVETVEGVPVRQLLDSMTEDYVRMMRSTLAAIESGKNEPLQILRDQIRNRFAIAKAAAQAPGVA